MFFWNSFAFLMIQWMLSIWSLVPLPFLNPAWSSGSSRFTYCWCLAWIILSTTLLACEMSAIVWYFEHSLALPLGSSMSYKKKSLQEILFALVSSKNWMTILVKSYTFSHWRRWTGVNNFKDIYISAIHQEIGLEKILVILL